MPTKTETFMGIADAHGIESFFTQEEAEKQGMILMMRASANRQRHAIVYSADVTKRTKNKVSKLLEKKEWKEALNTLKSEAKEVRVENGFERSWAMIPNSDLDPFH